MHENKKRHRLTTADIITLLRMAGTILLLVFPPLSTGFFLLYGLTGLTDVLDGWIARKTNTAGEFGARLDSIADLLFYAVTLLRIFPVLWNTLPRSIWYAVGGIVLLRLSAYLVAAIKYRLFASLHTYLNKLTGAAVFVIPFFLITDYAALFCWMVSVVAAASSLEELCIHLRSRTYRPNTKSILHTMEK